MTDKWTVLIVRVLGRGPRRFSALRRWRAKWPPFRKSEQSWGSQPGVSVKSAAGGPLIRELSKGQALA
jgi:hypothetical protein